jgi:hypothetical protein
MVHYLVASDELQRKSKEDSSTGLSDGLSGDPVGLSDAQFEYIHRRAKTKPSAPDDPTPWSGLASVYPTVSWKLTKATWTQGLQHRMTRRSVGAVVSENLNGYVTWEGHRTNRRPGKA